MTIRTFPSADLCTPEDLDAIADLVVSDQSASWDLAGSRAHIEALCRSYQELRIELDAERERCADAERRLARARTVWASLQDVLDRERNERQGEQLSAAADRAALDDLRRTRALDDQLRSTARAITGRDCEVVQYDLDAELAAHPEPGPLHHARDQRDHHEDTTP